MDYDYREKKIVIVLNSKLDTGVALNVVGHLGIALGYHAENHMGRKTLFDASNQMHLGISKYPVIVTKVNESKLKTSLQKAKGTEAILVVDYPSVMYDTGHDNELANALSKLTSEDIQYYGYLMFGNTDSVNSISGKFSLWR